MSYSASDRNFAHEINRYQRLREELTQAFPDIEEGEFADTLEGLTDLHEMLGGIIRSSLADQAMASGLKKRLEEMKSRFARLDERASKKRQLALKALLEADIKKLMQPDFTVSVRPGTRALVVVAEGNIPEEFWISQPPKLDRQGVMAALKAGTEVAGASLNNPAPTLSVRTR